jgi:hypothetical protein
LRSNRRLHDAAEQYVAAAELAPTDGGRAAAAARALRDASLCQSAEQWYAKAVQLQPEVSTQFLIPKYELKLHLYNYCCHFYLLGNDRVKLELST